MATFYVLLQERPGCDYTIGCGAKLVRLKATTFEKAEVEVMSSGAGGLGYEDYVVGEGRLDSIEIFEVANALPVDLEKYRIALRAAQEAERTKAVAAQERAEFERLSKKFGGP